MEVVRVALAVLVGDCVAVAVAVIVTVAVALLVGVSVILGVAVIVAVGASAEIACTALEAFTIPGPHVSSVVHAFALESLGNVVRLLAAVKY